jgi:hypothetical protein
MSTERTLRLLAAMAFAGLAIVVGVVGAGLVSASTGGTIIF